MNNFLFSVLVFVVFSFVFFCHLCQTNIYHQWSLTLFLVSLTDSPVALVTPGIQRESWFFPPHARDVVISSLSSGFCGFCWKSWSHHCPFHHCLVWVFSTYSLIPIVLIISFISIHFCLEYCDWLFYWVWVLLFLIAWHWWWWHISIPIIPIKWIFVN